MALVQTIVYIIILFHICTALSGSVNRYRLPKYIQPINYKWNVKVNPEESFFTGKVQIKLNVLNENTTGVLFLHADHNYIKIEKIQLNEQNCNYSIHNDVETQIFPIKCPTNFSTGQELMISYKGLFSKEMNGFYKSKYDNKILAATMFQPIYARRAFPCFDEPLFKATFEITVEHPTRYKVLANTPMMTANTTKNITVTTFEKTPKMSSYLVALIISRFEPAIDKDQNFNVFARHTASENLGIAKKYGHQLFECLNQWTGIGYDTMGNVQEYLVAIPDFAAGAMENWGLISFRELDLLDDGNKTSNFSFQTILMVMSHEIAHQWFGNYVTLDWWSNTWLNEGFAEYFGKVVTDMVYNGTLEIDDQFVVDITQNIMEKDALPTTNPLSAPEDSIKTTLEISMEFNEIAYLKGESIIRMMRYILGEEEFKKGLQTYLTQNCYSNTNPEILLKALESATNNTVPNFVEKMHNWIYQAGFPIVTVQQKNETTISISQKRFCLNNNCNSSIQWFVPISYTTQKEKDFSVNIKYWLEPQKPLYIPHNQKHWIILNIQQSGFYRVNYDNQLWDIIIKDLNTKKGRESIHHLNRAQLIDDIFHIAQNGEVSYEKVFNLVRYLKNETSYYPWVSAFRSFTYLFSHIDQHSEKLLKAWLLKLITSAFPHSTEYKTHVDSLKETVITEFSCKLGQKECIIYAKKHFQAFKNKKSALAVNKKYLILCYGLMESENVKEDFDFLLKVFKKSTSSHDQYIILSALGCTRDEEMLKSYLNLTLTDYGPIREQDFAVVFNSIYFNNKMGVGVALDFMAKHLKNMEIAYGGASILSSLMLDIASKISTPENIHKMNNILINNKDNENVKLVGPSILEIIHSNQKWQVEHEKEIQLILSNFGYRCTSNINIIVVSVIFTLYLVYV